MVLVEPTQYFELALQKDLRGGNAWHQVQNDEEWARVSALAATPPLEKGGPMMGPRVAVRYQEGILEEGELVAVRGRAVSGDLEAAPAHSRDVPRAMVLRGRSDEHLLISDEPA